MVQSPRRIARELALKGLYAFETGQVEVDEIIENIIVDDTLSEKNIKFAKSIFQLVNDNRVWADEQITALADNWDLERIAIIDLIILRIGLIELEKMPDIPVKVVLNEAIELAKTFSTSKSFSFINGILDKFVQIMEENNKL
ncbi:MAG: transcription antitermination factor NusB [Candidatus Zixiibacteriota bacterium]|nr:MAG: transcription antitermination factor NusB [candidate division Zixibacteria bacterium]